MAKEMMIVFIYDTIKNDEFHDPMKSVVYFHPSWVSETQKLLLCGQLMGTAHFLSETLFKPKIISLQSGKFAIKSFGRFLLAVGSDRNMSEIVLEHRAHFLYTLIKMYHCDINAIYEQLKSAEQESKFEDKMYSIMESYLPLLQYNGNIFQNVSSLKIPKSASNLYLETNQILQSFQQTKGVLGGTILYHNKVVASQLSDNLTKIFTLSDLYRLKSSEYIVANYHIPIGVTLINAYIPANEFSELSRSSSQAHNLFNTAVKDIVPFQLRKKSFSKDSHSIMKRDKSLIFTNIPEEDLDDGVGTMKPDYHRKPSFNRPTHLPLLFKNPTTLDISESGFNSINFDETDSFPNFIGKTSVCSTPMTENKLLPHGNVLSICAANEDLDIDGKTSPEQRNGEQSETHMEYATEYAQKSLNGSPKKDNNCLTNFISNPHKSSQVRSSLINLSDSISPTEIDNNLADADIRLSKGPRLKNLRNRDFCKTIADPTYPIFNSDGCAVSYSLFKEFLELHYNDLKNFSTDKTQTHSNIENIVETCQMTESKKLSPVKMANSIKSRRDLNLPLKALDLKGAEANQSNIFDSPAHRKKLSGLQLTPLMSKLTILAMNDQQSSGFSSWDTTPGCSFNNPMTPLEYQPKRRKSKTFASGVPETDGDCFSESETSKPVKVELFICVQQNMTLVLILQEKSSEKEDMIHSLFETCVSKLTRIENSLHQVMSINVEGSDKGDGGYSFICLDSKWDVNNRCGPWTPRDLLTLNSLHNNFHYNRKLIELILKSQDAVIYAYRCGRSEIYYQQSSIVLPGLPPPQDAMGTVSLCAKRRLERDHRILLL
ncbi:AAEL011097-PA [Aedes aegypti]|uniref:AAEL011097-PA n=1 Tax=Aedes aegypti TaxID=7159 RepID=Q16R21_AEDAE|nr:AAEL011097-PA [Aedes aegypti]